jgi:hypothetical protein
MQYYFELYTLSDQLSADLWTALYTAIAQYSGTIGKFQIILKLEDNVVRYFVVSDKDLGVLSNNLENIVLRPVPKEECTPPKANARERFINFVTGGNLLDVKEKYSVKRGKNLEWVSLNVRSVAASKAITTAQLYFKSAAGVYSVGKKLFNFFPAQLLAIDFTQNTRYLKKTPPKYLNIEKTLNILDGANTNALFEVDTFPYFSKPYYLNIHNYDFDKHSFIIGASGSGKSKFIELFVDRIQKTSVAMNYRVIVIDPHAALGENLQHIPSSRNINFSGESTELFPGAGTDVTAATELTTTLFKSLLADQFNPKLERVMRFSIYVLLVSQSMSMDYLKRFLTDLELRTQILQHVEGHVPQNIQNFFKTDFNEIRTQHYTEGVLPIIALVDEMQMQPALVNESEQSLSKLINDNFLTVFSLNKVSMGEKVVKTVSGLLIQQIFLLAQARAFSQKVIMIIDEVSVVQNPALAQILAEARKFNLSVILTQQYFGQIEKDLQAAIFSNVFNYYAFKVSEEDARALEGNLNIELPKELVEQEHKHGIKADQLKVKIMTELHPRECLVRVSANGQILPCVKARTLDVPNRNMTANTELDTQKAANLKRYEQQNLPNKFVEGSNPVQPLNSVPAPEQPSSQPQAPVAVEVSEPTRRMSLRELLSEHSSSRALVNKRKRK